MLISQPVPKPVQDLLLNTENLHSPFTLSLSQALLPQLLLTQKCLSTQYSFLDGRESEFSAVSISGENERSERPKGI